MQEGKCFRAYPMFSSKLEEDLTATGKFLDIPDEKGIALCDFLGGDYYTYLTLGDGCDFETVKVCQLKGKLYIMRRIVEGTRQKEWPCGTCIEFHWVEAAWCDQKVTKETPEPEQEDCNKPWSGNFCVGRYDMVVKDGLIVDRRCNNRRIPEGVFESPRLCFDKDGCIEDVLIGKNRAVLYNKR